MKTLLVLALAAIPFVALAQSSDLDNLWQQLQKADPRSRKAEALAVCDKVLERDVVADFVQYPESVLQKTMFRLADAGVLESRMEDWETALSAEPKSERLNLLLATAYLVQERENTKGSKVMGELAPGQLRIRREGTRFITEVFSRRGRWEVKQSEVLSMPRKVLAGIVVSSGTARVKVPTLSVAGETVPLAPWKTGQVSRSESRGRLVENGDSLSISGAGFPLRHEANDDVFFVWQEVEGDFVIETTIEELLSAGDLVSAGLAVRSNMEPGATSLSLAFSKDGLGQHIRKQPTRGAAYWKALCASRPGDVRFVEACLPWMLAAGMNEEARAAAERLLASGVDPELLDGALFGTIFARSGLESPLRKARSESVTAQDTSARARLLIEQANHLQNSGRQEQAVAAWLEARALFPSQTLPTRESRQLLISLRNLGRTDEWKAEVKRFFLGVPGSRFGSSSETLMNELWVHTPCLGPVFLPVLQEAVNAGLAGEIASALEKTNGTPDEKRAAREVAVALRIAARDPEVFPSPGSQGNALPKMVSTLSPRGLALAAFMYQQTREGRPLAVKCLEAMLKSTSRDAPDFSKAALLAWKLQLDEMLGDTQAAEADLKGIANALSSESGRNPLSPRSSWNPFAMAPVIRSLIQAGDLNSAEKIASGLKVEGNGLNDPVSDALGMLELARGRGTPMPVIWSHPEGDEVRVFWEFVPDTWGLNPSREVRVQGGALPAQNGKYTLDIYAERGEGFSGDLAQEDLLVSLPQVESSGSWKGKFPADRSWIAAALREDGRLKERSPSVPAAVGSNLLSPFDGEKLKMGEGDWITSVKWYWAAPVPAPFPRNTWMISRLQHDIGAISIDHRPVPIDPNREYTFSGWLKADASRPEETLLGVLFYDEKGNQVGEFKVSPGLSDRWTLVTAKFGPRNTGGMKKIPPTAATAMVRLKVATQCEIGDVGFYESVPPK